MSYDYIDQQNLRVTLIVLNSCILFINWVIQYFTFWYFQIPNHNLWRNCKARSKSLCRTLLCLVSRLQLFCDVLWTTNVVMDAWYDETHCRRSSSLYTTTYRIPSWVLNLAISRMPAVNDTLLAVLGIVVDFIRILERFLKINIYAESLTKISYFILIFWCFQPYAP